VTEARPIIETKGNTHIERREDSQCGERFTPKTQGPIQSQAAHFKGVEVRLTRACSRPPTRAANNGTWLARHHSWLARLACDRRRLMRLPLGGYNVPNN
jgi:hypothetical protein